MKIVSLFFHMSQVLSFKVEGVVNNRTIGKDSSRS